MRQQMKRFQYPVLLTPAEEGGYVVTCRDMPQLVTQGENDQDALVQAVDAMDEVFATYMVNGMDFPEPSRKKHHEYLVSPPAETVAKAALYVAMREAGISKIQLAKQLGVDEKEVRRLLDPHYGSKLPRIAEAVQLLGKRLVIGLEPA
jgi:antitoxin HicB